MTKILTHRWIHFMLLLGLLLASVYYSASEARWRQEIQHQVFDTLNRLYPRESSGQVIIVDIDDDSLRAIGQWPWPRTKIATLVENLTALGAKVIAFDGLLGEPDRSSPGRMVETLPQDDRFLPLREGLAALPDHDEILAETLQKSGIFVAGFTYSGYTQNPRKPRLNKPILIKPADKNIFLQTAPHFDYAAPFLPALEKASAGNGSFMARPDADGVLRRTGLLFSDGTNIYPSLGLEAVRVAYGDRKLAIKIGKSPQNAQNAIDTAYRIVIGKYTIPIEDDALALVYYRKFDERGGDYVSARKIIDPDFHDEIRKSIQGKLVLIGSSAEGLKDLRS
ncbi:MAG: CHASE2 domain-containing protein, partial [Bdellovibrionales bacterium]